MKMTFRGWRREVKPHTHSVTPVQFTGTRYVPQGAGQPLAWDGPFHALRRVTNLGLGGSFLVDFDFNEEELENWLTEYVKANPAKALRILASTQAEAIIAIRSGQNSPPNA